MIRRPPRSTLFPYTRSPDLSRRSKKSVRTPIMAATAIPIEMLPSIDPATGKVLAHIGRTPPEMVGRTVVLARAAQKEWAKIPVRERCRRLRKLRECLMASRNELADAVVGESGKPREIGRASCRERV